MARSDIQMAGRSIRPGSRKFGHLHVGTLAAGTEVRVPYQVLHGAYDGPNLCLEGTLHGWEPMGAEVIRRAMLQVDPETLRGTIYCLPLAHPFTVEFGGTVESAGQRVSPADNLDLNQVWPGTKANGWLTQQLAHVLWTNVVSRCEYLIDFHDGTGACDEMPVAFPHAFPEAPPYVSGAGADGVGDTPETGANVTGELVERVNAGVLALAKAFGSEVIWWRQHPLNPRMLSGQCAINGIVPLVVETGGGGMIDEHVNRSVTCTLNVLKHLGMIDGELAQPESQRMVDNYVVYRSLSGGFYHKEPDAGVGSHVKKGQLLGSVLDPVTSEVLERCTAPVNGIVISSRIRMPINPGGYIAHIADTDAVIWER